MEFRENAALKIQMGFLVWKQKKSKPRKTPVSILKKTFGVAWSEGIFMGWRVRRALKSTEIKLMVGEIQRKQRSLKLDLDLGILKEEEIKQVKADIKELKSHFVKSLEKSLQVDDYLREKIYLESKPIETFLDDNDDDYQHEYGLRPYSENYETFNRKSTTMIGKK
eukprot:CAMPEP_0170541040 /NCGR_PEP_ID=MMETSP0211-20121228/894_1 /TAXON_ID=311385 /ORGANISM="Pseudokeronopsis sp., Strain OXSARD2" /LENGTH=165 /DNA_ID=CAMNT_0010843637 /DNA_START=435 /DNA_END=932 /DNA_ORIENTATION=-